MVWEAAFLRELGAENGRNGEEHQSNRVEQCQRHTYCHANGRQPIFSFMKAKKTLCPSIQCCENDVLLKNSREENEWIALAAWKEFKLTYCCERHERLIQWFMNWTCYQISLQTGISGWPFTLFPISAMSSKKGCQQQLHETIKNASFYSY